jgi:hypothetical protein
MVTKMGTAAGNLFKGDTAGFSKIFEALDPEDQSRFASITAANMLGPFDENGRPADLAKFVQKFETFARQKQAAAVLEEKLPPDMAAGLRKAYDTAKNILAKDVNTPEGLAANAADVATQKAKDAAKNASTLFEDGGAGSAARRFGSIGQDLVEGVPNSYLDARRAVLPADRQKLAGQVMGSLLGEKNVNGTLDFPRIAQRIASFKGKLGSYNALMADLSPDQMNFFRNIDEASAGIHRAVQARVGSAATPSVEAGWNAPSALMHQFLAGGAPKFNLVKAGLKFVAGESVSEGEKLAGEALSTPAMQDFLKNTITLREPSGNLYRRALNTAPVRAFFRFTGIPGRSEQLQKLEQMTRTAIDTAVRNLGTQAVVNSEGEK